MPFQRPHRLIFYSNFGTPSNNAGVFSYKLPNFFYFFPVYFFIENYYSSLIAHIILLVVSSASHRGDEWNLGGINNFSCSFLIAHPVYLKFFAFWQQMLPPPASCIFLIGTCILLPLEKKFIFLVHHTHATELEIVKYIFKRSTWYAGRQPVNCTWAGVLLK